MTEETSRAGHASTPPCCCRSTAGPTTTRASSSPSAAPTCAATPARSPFPAAAGIPSDADLSATALREAQEEIGLDPAAVELGEELPPTNTFVTGYRIHPFVGRIPHPGELDLRARTRPRSRPSSPSRSTVLRESYEIRRLVRRGVPIHTPTYEVEGQLIWGATARILGDLLAAPRLGASSAFSGCGTMRM